MTIRFFGGPFHGLSLGVIEIQKYLTIVSLWGRDGVRRFAFLPAIEDWPAVLAGRMKVGESALVHHYELVSTPQGLQFRSDPQGKGYRQSLVDDLNRKSAEGSRSNPGGDLAMMPPMTLA